MTSPTEHDDQAYYNKCLEEAFPSEHNDLCCLHHEDCRCPCKCHVPEHPEGVEAVVDTIKGRRLVECDEMLKVFKGEIIMPFAELQKVLSRYAKEQQAEMLREVCNYTPEHLAIPRSAIRAIAKEHDLDL